MTDFRALCAELVDDLELCDWPYKLKETIRADIDRARTALAEEPAVPQPQPPAEGEVGDRVAWLRRFAAVDWIADEMADKLYAIADILSQRHPEPVPVSERLPGPEDCLDEGWAWFFSPRVGWRQAVLPVSAAYTHWLPAHALPIPHQQENANDH